MLHEILLSLSGHPSPLFSKSQLNDRSDPNVDAFPLLSPPERALLTTISDLTELHIKLRQHLSHISNSHNSVICRTVATRITSHHLRNFQKKILEVEKAVLAKDAAFVGGYGIVPLSTIVGEFAPWTRRLEWLWEVARFILPVGQRAEHNEDSKQCSGPQLMDFLRRESYTGYTDLEEIALDLVKAAEKAWLKQMASWILWGKLPLVEANDLFIQSRALKDGEDEFVINKDLLPSFVSSEAASSLVFIGKSINQIKSRSPNTTSSGRIKDTVGLLLPKHLKELERLQSPFLTADFAHTVSNIRNSLSRNALAQLLPVEKVTETIDLLQRFLLLEQGEFAVSLIKQADQCMHDRHQSGRTQEPIRKAGQFYNLTVKDGELSRALNQTWAELESLQNDEDPLDEQLERARELIHLGIAESIDSEDEMVKFSDLLFPTPTVLSFSIEAPLDLFLSANDIDKYSSISSYLLSIRRAGIHLGSLWHNSSLRKCQPTPAGPPFSNSPYGRHNLEERRARETKRALQLRPSWAIASSALFLVSEIGAYLQGSVIRNHCRSFRSWLHDFENHGQSHSTSQSSTETKTIDSDDGHQTGVCNAEAKLDPPILDPSSLATSHALFLSSLTKSLFLDSSEVTRPLHQLLTSIEHFMAVMNRLSSIHINLDLEAEGVDVSDPTRSYGQEEIEVLDELERTRQVMIGLMNEIAEAVKNWEETTDSMTTPTSGLNGKGEVVMQEQIWHKDRDLGGGIEGLVMKMAFLLSPNETVADGDVETETEM